MWRLWSRALELIGSIRLPIGSTTSVKVGHPGALDAQGRWTWKEYVSSEKLYDVWGPHPESPWTPFHCVPLFAAIDRILRRDIGPTPTAGSGGIGLNGLLRPKPIELPPYASPGAKAPPWIAGDTWTILDLPGPVVVEAATWLVTSAALQPVCTFDNWPHPRGVLRPEHTLAELLRWATTIADARPKLMKDSPPLWICDSERLGTRKGSPKEFDNRYYLDDSILPGTALLRRAGITRVVYATYRPESVPVLDLEAYFADLLGAGVSVLHVDLADPDLELRRFSAPRTPRKVERGSYKRSAAGGFGTEIPEPQSGSSG